MHIGELSARTGVSRRSLRYYEQRGLLDAQRTEAGWREYDARAVTRVRNVQDLLHIGMTVDDIKQVAPCLDQDDHLPCADTETAIETHRARLHIIDSHITELQKHREELLRRITRMQTSASATNRSERREQAS